MTLQRALVALAVSLALAVLVALVWATQRSTIDLASHASGLELLRQDEQLDRALEQRLGRARLDPQAVATALRTTAAEAGKVLGRFDAPDGLRGLSADVDTALRTHRARVTARLGQAEALVPLLENFGARMGALRRAGETALRTRLPEDQRARLVTLLGETASYAIRTDAANADALAALIAEVDAARSKLDGNAAAAVGEVTAAAVALRSARDALQSGTEQFAAAPTGESRARLRAAHGAHFARQTAEARRYRQILAVYAIALLVAFAVIALRLRRSFAELDRANAELSDTNAHLEEVVDARTNELRKALEALRMQQAQLVQSEKMASLGTMVAGVAHEINTPLGYAKGNLETVCESLQRAEGAPDRETLEEAAMLLSDAQYGLTQIGELVVSLKNFSRLDRSQTEAVDLHEAIETTLKICHNQFKDRVEIVREFAELPRIRCAPSQLNQVFLNLLTNAAQAIDGAGTIRIATRVRGDDVEISVRDSGCGMDAQTQAHIFEPFFTTKPVGQGTGLGLSIVFRIIEDHGGTIRVESAPGAGAEFVVSLPVRGRAAAPAAAVAADPVIATANA